MSVQLVLLKSGEELVADVREIYDRENDVVLDLVLVKPVRVAVVQQGVLTEDTNSGDSVLSFVPWLSTSKDEEFFLDKNWVVTICEPTDDIRESYIKNIGVKDDSESAIAEDGSVSDL
tara:strand:+ start:741 stop:1094 length:354 start_codon:yes stop_codon:yes gene_type:complete